MNIDSTRNKIVYEILTGVETEYAFSPCGHDGKPLDRQFYSDLLVELAARRYPSLEGRDKHDLFLSNGSRLYVDAGIGLINLEYSTAECTSPGELVAQVRAGDRILAELARELENSREELQSAFISKTNFDYCGHTSGSHENYLHTSPQAALAAQLIPHLVTRPVYSGGGGFNEKSARVKFMLSPRVCYLEHVISEGAQSDRAIFTTRQEPLSRSRYGRLHLLCGEGVRYDMSEYLRCGATALIVRLIDSGLIPAKGVEIKPLLAIRAVAGDVRCRLEIGRLNGRAVTAIDIQRHYLEQVEAQLGGSLLPDWAEDFCVRWRAVLDDLQTDPMQLVGVLDWPTKLALYRSFVEDKGYDWTKLTSETDESFTEIREDLFALDIRFGDIADDGLFATLENSARPERRIVSDQAVAAALRTPPQYSRARLRGEWIERLSSKSSRPYCNWHGIFDRQADRSLRFDDPLGVDEVKWVAG
jgi:proteasome accessory factor A